ncbi:uncharacterized protein LOC132299805 [Cornus florida]|uniref:uncharacterized protein LOC132299805 n=1 Tax=Cornus florida TaxID=4283 RepID=UPI00289C4363|nr:uncharacterized protein LOC132299805 [Cornus florida]
MICQGEVNFHILEQYPDSVSKALTAAETIPYKDLPDVACVHELLFTCHCSKRHIIKSSSGDLRFSFACLQCKWKYLFVLAGTYQLLDQNFYQNFFRYRKEDEPNCRDSTLQKERSVSHNFVLVCFYCGHYLYVFFQFAFARG